MFRDAAVGLVQNKKIYTGGKKEAIIYVDNLLNFLVSKSDYLIDLAFHPLTAKRLDVRRSRIENFLNKC